LTLSKIVFDGGGNGEGAGDGSDAFIRPLGGLPPSAGARLGLRETEDRDAISLLQVVGDAETGFDIFAAGKSPRDPCSAAFGAAITKMQAGFENAPIRVAPERETGARRGFFEAGIADGAG
jgi:hypothetical protein